MARGSKRYTMADTSGGVCQFDELARPNQFADASNLWSAPAGQAETRPGYSLWRAAFQASGIPFVYTNLKDANGASWPTVADGFGNSFLDFGAANTYVYLNGVAWQIFKTVTGHSAAADVAGTPGTIPSAQYWTGTEWRDVGLRPDMSDFSLAIPADLVRTTSNGAGLRLQFPFRYLCYAGPRLDAFTVYDDSSFITNPIVGYRELVYQGGKNVLQVRNRTTGVFVNATAQIANDVQPLSPLPIGGAPERDACLPPSYAVIPEFNTAFVAYGGQVVEAPYNQVPVIADIERRDEIVYKIAGVKSPYYDGRDGDVVSAPNQPGFVPQLTAFPKADFVLYHQGQLFLARRGENTLRWSAPAQDGAYKVFPAYAFENVSTSDDDSGITGLAAFQENIVVFKRDSIWLATYAGLNFLDLPTYKVLKVVSGTGCVAHASIQLINGYLYFQAEDGFYRFDGRGVEKMSADIDIAFRQIDVTNAQFSSAVTLPYRDCYVCSAKLNNGSKRLFVYDYKRNAWWFWDDIPAEVLSLSEDGSDSNILIFTTVEGFVFAMNTSLDQLRPIKTYLQTWRIGDDGIVKTFRAARVNVDQVAGAVSIDVQVSDEDANTYSLSFVSSMEAVYGSAVYGTSTFGIARRRERRMDIRRTGRWLQFGFETYSYGMTRYWSLVAEAILEGTR